MVASDREANPPSSAREAQLISAPIMIDNTPPAVTIGAVRYAGGAAHVEFEAVDARLPAAALRIFARRRELGTRRTAADGVIDSLREKFALDLTGLAPGEHCW